MEIVEGQQEVQNASRTLIDHKRDTSIGRQGSFGQRIPGDRRGSIKRQGSTGKPEMLERV